MIASPPLRMFGDPVLRTPAREVSHDDAALKQLIGQIAAVMRAYHGVGLAAPQIGVLQRVVCFRASETAERVDVLVNPLVQWRSEQTDVQDEACLSLPGVLVPVPRALELQVVDRRPGRPPRSVHVEGFVARVVQHELDHLDGVLIIDRTDKDSRRKAFRTLHGR